MFDPTKSDGQISVNLINKRKEKKIKKKILSSKSCSVRPRENFHFYSFVFFYLIESETHMSSFAIFGSFQSRNNLFRHGFRSIYLKWKFLKYLTFFWIFFKIFVFWGPLDAHCLEFRENPTVSEFNEI